MSAKVTTSTRKATAPKESRAVVERMQAALVDLLDLSLQGKQAHWNIQGSHFRSVHLQLDDVIDDVRLWSDEVAERIATIGFTPDGRASTIAADSQVDAIDGGVLGTDKVIQQFDERLHAASERIKTGFDDLEEDPVSQDLMIAVAGGLDKHAWMFRAARD